MSEPPIQTGVDHVHAHPRPVGHRRIDLILALSAVFISAVSLYVAVEHGRIERQLVQENAHLVEANSWPFLQIDGEYSTRSTTRILLVNAGIGPAKLQTFQVFYQGRLVPDLYALLRSCCGLASTPEARHAQVPAGLSIADPANEVLRPGENRAVLEVPASPEQHDMSELFLKASDSITFGACYCSVFDQCWISNLATLRPREVRACPSDVQSFNHAVH